jgi:hypothetical protein
LHAHDESVVASRRRHGQAAASWIEIGCPEKLSARPCVPLSIDGKTCNDIVVLRDNFLFNFADFSFA